MHIGAEFVKEPQLAGVAQPGEQALHHPAVTAQPLSGLNIVSHDVRVDGSTSHPPAGSQTFATVARVCFGELLPKSVLLTI